MRPWQFKQKTIGFGISRNAYWTVLAATANLPPPLVAVNPKGEGGAIEGFIAPLSQAATKDDLGRPLSRGGYVVSSKDRKTVLRMLVLSKEEAGFDPGPFLRSPQSQALGPEISSRVAATWTLIQITFESHDPFVHDSLRFVLRLCQRLAELTSGVVADPNAMTYKLPSDVFVHNPLDPRVDVRDHVSFLSYLQTDHKLAVHTAGMRKFGKEEFEIRDVLDTDADFARRLLLMLCQSALLGETMGLGDKLGARGCLLTVAPGGFDRGRWEGIPVFELLPPTGVAIGDALRAWAIEPD